MSTPPISSACLVWFTALELILPSALLLEEVLVFELFSLPVSHFRAAASSAISSFEEPLLCSSLFLSSAPTAAVPATFQEAEAPPTVPFASKICPERSTLYFCCRGLPKTMALPQPHLSLEPPLVPFRPNADDNDDNDSGVTSTAYQRYYMPGLGKLFIHILSLLLYNSCALVSTVQARKLRIGV